jgi:AraC-like DNA-binding protein
MSSGTLASLFVLPEGQRRLVPWLATLTIAMIARLLPYPFVFAGVTDTYGILVFAPFDLALAWGPLLWGYVFALTTGAGGRETLTRVRWHLVPGALYVAYRCVCLMMPLDVKVWWYGAGHTRFVLPSVALLSLVSLLVYAQLSWTRYRAWSSQSPLNAAPRVGRPSWLRQAVLGGLALFAAVGVALLLAHVFVTPMIFLAEFPEALAYAALAYAAMVTGVRLAHVASDAIAHKVEAITVASRNATAERAAHYRAQAEEWRQRVVRAGWHRDPQLTLEKLAKALDTSPRTLSRVLNSGLETTFSALINGLRVEDATRMLAQNTGATVLEVAFAVGFASKASFHRAFKRHASSTPSELRAGAASQNPPIDTVASSETTG